MLKFLETLAHNNLSYGSVDVNEFNCTFPLPVWGVTASPLAADFGVVTVDGGCVSTYACGQRTRV